jgi:hypothetical protein
VSGTSTFSLIRGEQVRRYGVKNGSLRCSIPQTTARIHIIGDYELLAEYRIWHEPVDLATSVVRESVSARTAAYGVVIICIGVLTR